MKTIELTGAALDWAVAKCEGHDTRNNACVWFLEAESDDPLQFICLADDEGHAREQCENAYPDCTIDRVEHIDKFTPSTDWAQGGPIIEGEKIDVLYEHDLRWVAVPQKGIESYGPTPLIAAMRCYVASKLGDEIEIPTELGETK